MQLISRVGCQGIYTLLNTRITEAQPLRNKGITSIIRKPSNIIPSSERYFLIEKELKYSSRTQLYLNIISETTMCTICVVHGTQ